MKKILFFILIPIFLLSCHKNKGAQVTCDSYLIGAIDVSPGIVGTNITLATVSANNGQVIKNYKNIIQVSYGNGPSGVYDHIHNYYYLFGIVNGTRPFLFRLNTSTGVGDTLGYPVLDTNAVGTLNNLICNSTAGKLYFFFNDYYTTINEIYEVTPNDTAFSQRLIFETGNNLYIYPPVIDERTGYIYFFTIPVSGGDLNLIKVDPTSGNSSIVTTNPPISPFGLVYNNNDGLFYGLNVYHFASPPYNSASASFISIDPGTGAVTSIIDTIGGYDGSGLTAFDFCNNAFVIFGNRTTWYDPTNGKVIKQLNYQTPVGDVGVY